MNTSFPYIASAEGVPLRRIGGACFLPLLFFAALCSSALIKADDGSPAKAESTFISEARQRVKVGDSAAAKFEIRTIPVAWKSAETAVIVCDMWDKHWCESSNRRVAEVAPRMNDFVIAARKRGALIIHAPSDVTKNYADHPARQRAQAAPEASNVPAEMGKWCYKIPSEEQGQYPIDQSDGGCDDEKPVESYIAWKAQTPLIEIQDEDVISESGVEIWNLMEDRGIHNVAILGVHTNMCVLGRPFGLRNMSRYGKNVVLVRDLTDTMYNPRSKPYVDHFRGTDLIVEHIEKFVCPTITSDQLLGGQPFRFKEDRRPRVLVAIAEPEYKTWITLPVFAETTIEGQLGFPTTVIRGDTDKHTIAGFARAIEQADAVLLSVRRQGWPEEDLAALRKHVQAGKPIIGIRTANHAFDPRDKKPAGHASWESFDADVIGGHYTGHHGDGPAVSVEAATTGQAHAILTGVELPFKTPGSLYKVSPLASTATPLLVGSYSEATREPVAWTNESGKARVFYTSLGHAEDFENPAFQRLLANAILWCTAQPMALAERRAEQSK